MQLLSEHGVTQAESAALICDESQRPCSTRAVRSWLNDPDKASSRECPDWALEALETVLARRAEKVAAIERQARQQRVDGVEQGFTQIFAFAGPWLEQLSQSDLDLAKVLQQSAHGGSSEAALVAAEGFLATLGVLAARS